MASDHLIFTNSCFSNRVIEARALYTESPLYVKARRLRQRGEKIIDLSGNCVNAPPPAVYEAIRREVESGFPAPELKGLRTLREALAKVESDDRGFEVDPDTQVLVFGGGGMQALNLTLQAILNPGDEAVIFIPGLATDEMVKMAGGKPKFVRLDEGRGFKPDFHNLLKCISPKTKLIILNSPHNPTGYVWQRDELKQLAEVACDNDLLILSDDVFKYFVFDGQKPAFITDFPEVRDQVISVCSATKTYGMFNWRVSWLFAHPDIVRQVEKILFWNCEFAPPMTQVGVEAAIRTSHDWLKDQIKRMSANLEILYSSISSIPGIRLNKALGGPTMFPNITQIERSSMKLAHYLLETAGVLVAPGVFYLSDGHIRTGFWGSGNLLTESDMHEAASKLTDVIPKYIGREYHITV